MADLERRIAKLEKRVRNLRKHVFASHEALVAILRELLGPGPDQRSTKQLIEQAMTRLQLLSDALGQVANDPTREIDERTACRDLGLRYAKALRIIEDIRAKLMTNPDQRRKAV